jgi:membrane protease YdiL (CAAX protease family)
LWLDGGLRSPWFTVIALGMMVTPAVAAIIVVFFIERSENRGAALGLWPLRPARRLLTYLALGLAVPIALVLAALPVGALLGVYPADFVHFSGFQQVINSQLAGIGGPEITLPPISLLVAAQIVNVFIGAFINLVPALGEELGWRGWLLPKLMRWGTVPALLTSGIIWGLWHAPLILLGYNYPDAPGWLGVAMMVGTCVVIGTVFGWLRLRSNSVWPAALAHGAFNAAAGFSLVFSAAGRRFSTVEATILGWSGWIVPIVLIVALAATRQFSPTPKVARKREAAKPEAAPS